MLYTSSIVASLGRFTVLEMLASVYFCKAACTLTLDIGDMFEVSSL